VAINPILPILPEKRGVREFVRRGLRIGRKQFLGQAGPWGKGIWLVVSTGPALGWTFARKYRASAALIRSIAEFQWEQLERAPATPVHLLLGAGDEFFTPSTDLEATLRAGPFPTALVPPVSGQNSHEWLLLDPKLAAELVDGALRAG
jgi:hypothetical protein